MSETAQRYLELLDELSWKRVTGQLSEDAEFALVSRLADLWEALPEGKQDAIEKRLEALDAERFNKTFERRCVYVIGA